MADSDHPEDFSTSETAMSAGEDRTSDERSSAARKPFFVKTSVTGIVEQVTSWRKEQALARVTTLAEQAERTYFELGGLLAQIQKNKWYRPEVSFACYVAKNLPVSYRQALHYI